MEYDTQMNGTHRRSFNKDFVNLEARIVEKQTDIGPAINHKY